MTKQKEFKLNSVSVIEYGRTLSIKIGKESLHIIYDFEEDCFMLIGGMPVTRGQNYKDFCDYFNLPLKTYCDGMYYNNVMIDYDTYKKIRMQFKTLGFIL
jgi:hypothetical protein